jgi:hypothetical protein
LWSCLLLKEAQFHTGSLRRKRASPGDHVKKIENFSLGGPERYIYFLGSAQLRLLKSDNR